MTIRSNTSSKANPASSGFWWPTIISPLATGSAPPHPAPRAMVRAPKPDSPTGPAPHPGNPARSGYCQDNAPIPFSIALGVIGYFPMVFARRSPQLNVGIGAGRRAVSFANQGSSTTGNPLLGLPVRSVFGAGQGGPLCVFLRASYADNKSPDSCPGGRNTDSRLCLTISHANSSSTGLYPYEKFDI